MCEDTTNFVDDLKRAVTRVIVSSASRTVCLAMLSAARQLIDA
jgi:hypothetical protein